MQSINELRKWGRAELVAADSDVVGLEVDVLLAHVLGCDRLSLFQNLSMNVDAGDCQRFIELVARRKRFEPVAYLTGAREFFGLGFCVSPAVLIPRPETELVVEEALKCFSAEVENFQLVDVGTGSGAIVVAILCELRKLFGPDYLRRGRVVATDMSGEALEVARQNARLHQLSDSISFLETDLLSGVSLEAEQVLTLIVSNPPYIPVTEKLPPDVDNYEPQMALRGGKEGLEIIGQLFSQAAPHIRAGARLILEIGFDQRLSVESLILGHGLNLREVHRDFQGIERVLVL